ncbi:hypothetical protein ELI_0271 [Eubacterium callanderi]|uniref:Uncharacterized protein n=1 Tax=Eubacterium callanderi TaxID=53442 RepID=E3GI05_9FIRM|nr:hypothetical protein ELI_0271 [Eubacterium callanderi]
MPLSIVFDSAVEISQIRLSVSKSKLFMKTLTFPLNTSALF